MTRLPSRRPRLDRLDALAWAAYAHACAAQDAATHRHRMDRYLRLRTVRVKERRRVTSGLARLLGRVQRAA